MPAPNRRLREIVDRMDLTNIELAKTLDLDPSLVSRYLSGSRALKAASPQLDALADFVLARMERGADAEWLMRRFSDAGLPTDISTVYRMKQNLVLYLASDGDKLIKNLGAPLSVPGLACEEGRGTRDVARVLAGALDAAGDAETIDVFLSSDQVRAAVDRAVSDCLLARAGRLRIVVCVSGDTRAMSALINTYMAALVSGRAELSVVHGMSQAVANQMCVILPGSFCLVVSETVGPAAPAATLVRDPAFVREAELGFDAAARFARSVLTIYDDNYSRNILEILFLEFCGPGALDLVKDSVNPLYMDAAAYDRFLGTRGHAPEEYAWRSAEFARFQNGMNLVLAGGARFREILSLARLNDIAERGTCRMSGLYFMELGYADLDAEGCARVLEGYIAYLNKYPNFSVLILDDFARLHEGACWQLKREHHIAINDWQSPRPVMVYSDQLMLLREFQAHFDRLWALGAGGAGGRGNAILILKDVLARLRARHRSTEGGTT